MVVSRLNGNMKIDFKSFELKNFHLQKFPHTSNDEVNKLLENENKKLKLTI